MTSAVLPRPKNVVSVEDVQGRPDTRQIPINRVGIKDIRHPVKVKDRAPASSTRWRLSTCT